ncbi:MAG: GNAT family N-acetyltransferase [Ilumatobacteraceae bacterium]
MTVGPIGLRLRPASATDEPLLFDVYAGSRAAELAQVPWTVEQKQTFLEQQHRAQVTSYRQRHPHAQFLVIELDGVGIGRLFRDRLDTGEIRVLDIGLLPDHCGRGFGTALLGEVLAEADALGVVVSLHVEFWNPALRLYQRLGFVEAARDEVYLRMERAPVGIS